MKKVSIIGAGQLGSRHLQGLKTAQSEMGIWVIDASEESLKVAKERCEAVESKTPKTVHYEQNIDVLPQNLDLVIVATGSKPRASIIKALLAHSTVSYLVLEKFLFTRLQDYDEIEALLKEKGVKSWVNCPRRMWPSYEAIKKLINKDKPVSFESGTKIEISRWWPDGHANHGFIYKLVNYGIKKIRQEIGRRYASILRDGNVQIFINNE